jgi:alcohol dehydrogenase class IV
MSHPIGAMFNTHHGTTNAVCMPAVLDFNAPAIAARFDRAAGYLGIKGGFDGFRSFVERLNDNLGVPKGLAALGITEEHIPALAREAINDPSCTGNPIKLTQSSLEELFQKAL